MKKRLLICLCSFILFFIALAPTARATHIMGGSLTYEYLGLNTTSGLYDYRVKITIYRYCAQGSSLLPTSLDIGVYEDNPANPSGDKIRILSSSLGLLTQQQITPPNANDSCTFAPNVCVEEGVYQAVLSVAGNTTGYHFISDICCRNNNIANLNNAANAGQAYYAFAPASTIVNSSPTFAIAPVPFICATDTATILNQAYDIDGDLLVYNFVVPYNGISNNGNPTPNPPLNYPWTIATINYAPTYSLANPFGPGGFTSIDNATGLASYYAPNQGFFVLAVEIEEYRNGVLIGITRRDLQIIVIACPINPAPVISSGSQINYIINEGQTLCFANTFNDSNGDSIFITHTGDIFNSAITNPPATYTDASGAGTATGNFCWTTSCDQGRTTPYQFSVLATDNGCPAKVTNVVYTITVVNTPVPTFLNGPDTLCLTAANGITYTVNNVLGYTHNWVVTNGTITGPQNGTSINVNFTAPGTATVSSVTVNSFGCVSDTITKLVEIIPQPSAIAGPDISFCSGGSASLGAASVPGYIYSWSPATNLSGTNVSNPTVTVTNIGTSPVSTTYILTTNLNGCSNTDTVVVTTNPNPAAVAGPDVTVCSGITANIGGTGVSGVTYNWTPSTGLSDPAISNPTVTITTGTSSPDTVQYILQASNSFGCNGVDTVNVIVNPAPNALAGANQIYCSGASLNIGAAPIAGYNYSWSPATGLSSTTISNPTVSTINTGTSNDTLFYIVTVTLGNCTDQDTVRVIIKPNPLAVAGPDLLLCGTTTGVLGDSVITGYTYTWSPATGLDDPNIPNPTVTVIGGTTPDTLLYIVTSTLNGCVTNDTVLVISGPAPIAFAGTDKNFCSGIIPTLGTASTPGYTYSWSPATGISNITISNPTLNILNPGTANDTTYYIVTTFFGPCSAQDTVRVIVRPRPVSNAGTDVFLCGADSIEIGGPFTQGYFYSWTPVSGLSSNTISNPVVTVNNPGTTPDSSYFVVVTTLNGCTTTDSVLVVSGPNAAANAGNDISICSGASATIGALTDSAYTYSWSPATGLSSGTISDPSVTLINISGVNDTLIYIITSTLYGCEATDTVQVIVRPNPVSNAGLNQLVCAGSTVQLGTGITAGYTYSWSPATGLNNTTISDPTLTLSNTGTTPDTLQYIVTTTLNGCITTDTVQVISAPAPVADAGPDVIFCSGQTANIGSTGTAGYVYTWNPSTGLNSATSSNPSITLNNLSSLNDTLNYVVTVNAYGCLDTDTITIIIKPLPVAAAGPDITLCGGDTITIGSSSVSGYNYIWTPATGLNNTTISNPVATVNNSGAGSTTITYTVSTTWNGCSSTDSMTITVNPQPIVTATATPLSICNGSSTTLTGTGATTFSWALASTPGTVLGIGGSLVVSPTITTTYIMTGTNGVSCSNIDSVTITVNPIPSVQINSASTTLCDGDTLTLTGTGAVNYDWSILGGAIIGTGTTIQVSPTTNTTYVVVGTDGNSCSNSDTITITILPAATISGISGNISVCPGVTGVQYFVNNPNPNSTYNWVITGGSVVTGQGGDTITVDWSSTPGTGIVSVIEVTDLGCQSEPISLPVSINVILTPVAPTGPTTFCANDANGITYTTLNTPGSTYTWTAQGGTVVSGNGTNTVVVNWTAAGPTTVYLWYDETSTTITNVCFGTSDSLAITLNPAPTTSAITGTASICVNNDGSYSVVNTPGSTYAWTITGGTILTGDGTNSITTNWSGSGNATISVTETNSFGCVGSAVSIPVTVNALPLADAGSSVGVCIGQSVQLNATGGVNYSWSPSTGLNNTTINNPVATPLANTTYTVLVTDANGCENSDSVTVTVDNLPIVTVTQNSAICIGGTIQLTAGGGTNYQWSPASSLNDPSSSTPVANPSSTTTYTVVVTNAGGCVDSASVTITVNALPVAVVSADTTICEGTTTTLFAGGGVSYSWSPASSLNNSTSSNPVATPSANTTYTVVVTDVNGCTDDAQVNINLNTQPISSFEVDPNLISASCSGAEALMINTSIDAINYYWIFADGTTSTDVNPQHLFTINGDNLITLIAYNNICSDTSTLNYNAATISNIIDKLPNVFSPNGDGLNECFDLGNQFNFNDCSDWRVFDRWGKEVFHSTASTRCWNGKKDNAGADSPAGTYFLTMIISGEKYSATITLVR